MSERMSTHAYPILHDVLPRLATSQAGATLYIFNIFNIRKG